MFLFQFISLFLTASFLFLGLLLSDVLLKGKWVTPIKTAEDLEEDKVIAQVVEKFASIDVKTADLQQFLAMVRQVTANVTKGKRQAE